MVLYHVERQDQSPKTPFTFVKILSPKASRRDTRRKNNCAAQEAEQFHSNLGILPISNLKATLCGIGQKLEHILRN